MPTRRQSPPRNEPPSRGASPPLSHGPRAWRSLAAAAALVALVLAVYTPLLWAGYIWDDDSYVTHNSTLRSADGLRRIWCEVGAVPQYYPLVHSTFWVEYHLWALNPLGYHLVNVLLHATSVLLLWRLLLRLRVPGAWLAAAVFAVHPVMVESVAWVTERKNVLSLALALGSLLAYLRFAPAEEEETERSPGRWAWYGLALLLFAGALLSKTVVATLPAVLLVIYWWQRGRITPRDVLPLLPFFTLGIALGLVTVRMEKYTVGAVGKEWDFSPVDRVLIAGRALWFYAGKLAWPYPLVFFYPRWTIDAHVWWQYLFPAAALGVIVALWLARQRIGRGPLAAVLIFAGVLAPALGFFDVFPMRFSFVADHFQYHAASALVALAVACGTLAARRLPIPATAAAAAAAALLLALGALTYRQTRVYDDLEALYRETLVHNPDSSTAHANLGVYLADQGKYEESLHHAREAVRLNPREFLAHNNAGTCLLRLSGREGLPAGAWDEAIAHFRAALQIDPNFIAAHVNLAAALSAANRLDEAEDELQSALRLAPQHAEAHYALAGLLVGRNDLPGAAEHYRAAIEAEPGHARALNNLGIVLIQQGQTDNAIRCFEESLRQDPDYAEARANLAKALQVKNEPTATE